MIKKSSSRVALVYDRINKWGGAERVLLALHEIFPDAPLYTSVYDEKLAPWAKVFKVRTSFLQKLPIPKNKHEYYPFLMGIAFESFNFDEFDLVISVTHEFSKAIITKPETRHFCYCLNPVSYLWSGYDDYFKNKEILKFLAQPMIKYLRWYDKIVCHRPDKYIAISQTVQERIKKYYGLPSDIIYPPVTLPKISSLAQPGGSNYFLVVSRLVPNKKIDQAIKAFNQTNLPLKIVGIGSQESYLKNLAHENIEFLGQLSDEQVVAVYQSARAVIIPAVEDFNIVAVEAQSFGKPVIAYHHGGVTETVIAGKTGQFFASQENLIQLINNFDEKKFNFTDCVQNAARFSKKNFHQQVLAYVQQR